MNKVRKNEILAVFLFAVGLFLFLSIFTFSEQDISFFTSSPNILPQNVTGIIGAYISSILIFFIGKASYVIPLLVFVWGIFRLFQIEEEKILLKLFGTKILILTVSSCLSMIFSSDNAISFSYGGICGIVISNYLIEYLGRVGAYVFIMALILMSFLVATEFLLLPFVLSFSKFFIFLPKVFGLFFSKISKKVAENKQLNINNKKEKINIRKDIIEKKIKNLEEKDRNIRVIDEKKESIKKSIFNRSPKIVKSANIKKTNANINRISPFSDNLTGQKIAYKLPSVDLFDKKDKGNVKEREEDFKKRALILEKTLLDFGVEAKVVKISRGPVITMYELEPSIGTKVNKITSLSDNIALSMRAINIRIVAPLPGKGTIGIEVPNEKSELVLIRDIFETLEYNKKDSLLKFALGKDVSGNPIIPDLAKMPHLLIAGATGSGKTVCINCIISSFIFNASPNNLKFLMIDPKRVELMPFSGIPHLISPIITNPKKAAEALNWVIYEMERRYKIFAKKGVRNIDTYKKRLEKKEVDLPYIVVVVDELADLMMVGQQSVESAIMRIAQLSRAAGIHMILATQRPSVNVITGVIKANFPARISFKVASKVDSRTVLDSNGAEKLMGRGDMLLLEPAEPSLIRGQCSLVDDKEIKDLVKNIKNQASEQYIDDIFEKQKTDMDKNKDRDELYTDAVNFVIEKKQASVSLIQRRFRIGYNRASRIVELMEEEGILGPSSGSKRRDVLIEEYNEPE